jgi:hypothetical protein
MPHGNPVTRFNARVAVITTKTVGSMWCAYAFGLFDLISLPAAIGGGSPTIVSWVAQTFLQLVLLSIIMVGQDVQASATNVRNEQAFQDVEAILHGESEQAAHLAAQDEKIVAMDGKILAILTEISLNTQLTEQVRAAVTPAAGAARQAPQKTLQRKTAAT